MKNDFKNKFSFETRKKESDRIKSKYNDRIPIIVTRSKNCNIEKIDKNKFLVPEDLTIGQFLFVIRKRISIKPEESLFLMINGDILATSSNTIGSTYHDYKDEDGFLYFTYCGENVFGN